MSRAGAILLTGATGFVGGAIVLELLEAGAERVVCVVRPGADGTGPEQRLRQSLERACREYARADLLDRAIERCTAVAGDLTKPMCGVDPRQIPAVDKVWHAAASLAFEDEQEEAIAAANIGGTKQALALAEALEAGEFNHISTAYVGGARGGLLHEEVPPADAPSNNAYERTKLVAEELVSAGQLSRVRIFRPSIVIGHSQTFAATAFTGLYGFIRNLRLLNLKVSEVLGDMLRHRPLRLIADGGAQVNFIPIDHVARSAVAIAGSESRAQVFHLTNSAAPELDTGLAVVAEMVGIAPPRYVDSADRLTSIDLEVDRTLQFYRSYISQRIQFDRTNTDAVLGAGSGDFPMSAQTFRPFVSWYLDRLDAADGRRDAIEGVVA